MRVEIDMTGDEALIAQLIKLGAKADDVVKDYITDLVTNTQGKAVEGITQGPASGRVYEKYNPRRTHQASAPGEYPMSDTGQLAASIQIDWPTTSNLTGKVGTAAMHGLYQEFGTSRMAARPWLLPSFEWARSKARGRLKKQIEALT